MNNIEAFEVMRRDKLEELLDEYFDLAVEKGRNFERNGLRSNQVRKEILSLFDLASQAQQEPVSQWQPIATAPKNKKIIVRYKNALGKDRTVFAKYLDKFTEEASEGTDCETDYCEDDDTFYCKEGWVELIDNWDDFSSVYFDSRNVPTHWMPLPPAPEGDKP